MKSVCVYSGSSMGNNTAYKNCAQLLGALLAKNDIELVYGGSNIGLMGVVADSVLDNGGKATGVIPTSLFPKQILHTKITKLIDVADMHERKKTMAQLADGFIALPGGVGTFEELFEILSWAQLKIHTKPIGLLNVDGFFDPVIDLINKAIEMGFMNSSNLALLLIDSDPATLLQRMQSYSPPTLLPKWEL